MRKNIAFSNQNTNLYKKYISHARHKKLKTQAKVRHRRKTNNPSLPLTLKRGADVILRCSPRLAPRLGELFESKEAINVKDENAPLKDSNLIL